MEMGEERAGGQGLTSHPGKALHVQQLLLGDAFDGGEKLVEDPVRFLQNIAHRAAPVIFINPGVDIVIRFEVSRPGGRRLGLSALHGLEAGAPTVVPGLPNQLTVAAPRLFPRSVVTRVAGYVRKRIRG